LNPIIDFFHCEDSLLLRTQSAAEINSAFYSSIILPREPRRLHVFM